MEILFYLLIFLIFSWIIFLIVRSISKGLDAKSNTKKNKYTNEAEGKNLSMNNNEDLVKNTLDEFLDQVLIVNKFKEIVFLNKNAALRFGENLEGKHLASILRAPEILESFDICIENNEKQIVEVEIKNPIYQFFSATIFPHPENNNFIIIVLRDLTEIAKVQKFKSDFVANASHELRTPLQSIKLGLETINQGHAKNDFEAQKKFVPIMLEQAQRMENLIRDLLSLSKIELEEHIRPNKDIDLKDIIDHVIQAQNQSLSQNDVKINFDCKKDARRIVGDRDKLIEIFSNLIENAIKYSERGKNINISLKKKNDQILASVKDSGVGIPKDLIPRVTERFFRVDPEKSKKVGGTGLGLAIVKHLVLQHRGELNITSEEGKGSEFIVSFPAI
jgi:two-component system, OmpR family, phosphate regulon sensor histidine kinase PhoR